MNWVKRTLAFIGLMYVLLVAFSATANAMPFKTKKQSSPKLAVEKIQNSAFIQPQLQYIAHLQVEKDSNPQIKWQATFLTPRTSGVAASYCKSYLNQDINRCKKVSILLFPFHFFW